MNMVASGSKINLIVFKVPDDTPNGIQIGLSCIRPRYIIIELLGVAQRQVFEPNERVLVIF